MTSGMHGAAAGLGTRRAGIVAPVPDHFLERR